MITTLRLQHFRSYTDERFTLSPGVNIVVGPNASGKTNLLEAVLVLARGASYRAKDAELVQFNEDWARLDAELASGAARTLKLQPNTVPSKTYEIDGKVYKRLSMDRSLPVVLFEPNHLRLLSGSPEQRRNYLDDLLEQTLAGYGGLLRQYKRALAQRNSLLKSGQSPASLVMQLFPWNVRLSELGGQIVNYRQNLVAELVDTIPGLYQAISKTSTKIDLQYLSSLAAEGYESQMLQALEKNLDKDRLRGFTSVGPHREDLEVLFNDRAAAFAASRGEARTLVLALKVVELQLLEKTYQQKPLLLLDDVFSELDSERRRALTEHLAPYQTFITTTDADVVLQHFNETCNIISTNKG